MEIEGATLAVNGGRPILEDDPVAAAIRQGLVPPPSHRRPPPAPTAEHLAVTLEPTARHASAARRLDIVGRAALTAGIIGLVGVLALAATALVSAPDTDQALSSGDGAPSAGAPAQSGSTGGDGGAPPAPLPGPSGGASTDGTAPGDDTGSDSAGTGEGAGQETGQTGREPSPDPGADGNRAGGSNQADQPGDGRADGSDRTDQPGPAGDAPTAPGADPDPSGVDDPDADPDDTDPALDSEPSGATPTTAACFVPVLTETFDGPSLDTSVWEPYDSAGNAGHGLRRPSAITVADGILTITADMEGGQLVSGGMRHRHTQAYGRYEVTVRTSADRSETMSGVVLTWPRSENQAADGENDLYETLAIPGDRSRFHSFIHRPGGSAEQQDTTVHAADATQWHTVVMEWTPDAIRLYRDGQLVKTVDDGPNDRVPDAPHFAAIQLDAWSDSLPAPVMMQVDAITVSAYDPDRC